MKIQTQYPFCVACFKTGDNSREHILLDSLGGLLWANLLCADCNKRFGHDLDYQVKTDPQIRWAVEHMRDQIGNLYQEYNRRNRYIGKSKEGPPIRMSMGSHGNFRMLTTKLEDGSILEDTSETRNDLKRELEKSGRDPGEVNALLTRFDNEPNDVQFEIKPGLSFIKRDVSAIQPDFRGELISERLIAKLGYLHFCLCITPEILMNNRQYINPIVDFIRGGDVPGYLEIRRGLRGQYQPNHMFRVHCKEDRTTLKFQLFGAIAFDVTLRNLVIPDREYPVIIHNLTDRCVYRSRNWEEFRQNKIYMLPP